MALGEPEWQCACCRPVADCLPRLEIVFLDLGLLLSLYSGYRIAQAPCAGLQTAHSRGSQVSSGIRETYGRVSGRGRETRAQRRALKVFAPWTLLIVLLFAAGVWIVLQPMQMRGTMFAAG